MVSWCERRSSYVLLSLLRQPRCVRGHNSDDRRLVQRVLFGALGLNVPLDQRSGPTTGTCELLQQLRELSGPGLGRPRLPALSEQQSS